MIRRFIKDPLAHFLLLGLLLFIIYAAFAPEKSDLNTIIIDRSVLLNHFQNRTKVFNKVIAERRLDAMSDDMLKRLINDYALEEVLFREANLLDLGKDDYVIRQRMVAKFSVIAESFVDDKLDVKRENLDTYFKRYKEQYYIEPLITFTHVFLDYKLHGVDKAIKLAKQKLSELNNNSVIFADAPKGNVESTKNKVIL